MKFTEEQFDEILGYDKYLYLEDLPFGELEDKGLKLFNSLPDELQGLAVQWGTSDTVFRDDLFEFLIENQFGMTVKAYYASGILDKYFETKVPIPIDYDFLNMTRKERLQSQLKSKHTNVSYENKEKRTSFDETFGQDKMDLAKKVIGDNSDILLQKLTDDDKRVRERYLFSIVNILDKEYNGFESLFDLSQDIDDAMDNPIIPPEMSGKIKIRIDFIPNEEDCEYIKITTMNEW